MKDLTKQQISEILSKIDFKKGNGLVPVITQEVKTNLILMVAYANKQAIEYTLVNKKACYYSRSRKELWVKGLTSGNYQDIIDVLIDCDNDTILYKVIQHGNGACHTGNYSCFYRKIDEI